MHLSLTHGAAAFLRPSSVPRRRGPRPPVCFPAEGHLGCFRFSLSQVPENRFSSQNRLHGHQPWKRAPSTRAAGCGHLGNREDCRGAVRLGVPSHQTPCPGHPCTRQSGSPQTTANHLESWAFSKPGVQGSLRVGLSPPLCPSAAPPRPRACPHPALPNALGLNSARARGTQETPRCRFSALPATRCVPLFPREGRWVAGLAAPLRPRRPPARRSLRR